MSTALNELIRLQGTEPRPGTSDHIVWMAKVEVVFEKLTPEEQEAVASYVGVLQ